MATQVVGENVYSVDVKFDRIIEFSGDCTTLGYPEHDQIWSAIYGEEDVGKRTYPLVVKFGRRYTVPIPASPVPANTIAVPERVQECFEEELPVYDVELKFLKPQLSRMVLGH